MNVDRLAEIAAQLTGRMREFSAEDNARWLAFNLPDPSDWFRLAFVLACAVPTDRTWLALTSWTRPDSADLIAERQRQLMAALTPEVRRRQAAMLTSTTPVDGSEGSVAA